MWTFLTQGSWHGGPQSSRTGIPAAGLETLSSELHRRLWNDSTKRSVADFRLSVVVWIKPIVWGLGAFPLALILELGSCTGSCGSVSWLGLGSTACWSGIKVGLYVCVSVCGKVRFATHALTVSAACSCRFIKLCKTSLCFVLAMLSFIHNDCFVFNL